MKRFSLKELDFSKTVSGEEMEKNTYVKESMFSMVYSMRKIIL